MGRVDQACQLWATLAHQVFTQQSQWTIPKLGFTCCCRLGTYTADEDVRGIKRVLDAVFDL